jgi:hypothetical protein
MLSDEFCACITTNMHFKFFFVLIFGIVLTFIENIDILKNQYALSAILLLLIMMSYTHLEELGSVILLMILFVLLFNIIAAEQSKKELADNK